MTQADASTPATGSLRFTGTRCLVSSDAIEGRSTTTALSSLTSYTWMLRLRIDRFGGEDYAAELGAGPAQGNLTSLGWSVNPDGGRYVVKLFARVNDGSRTEQVGVQFWNAPRPPSTQPIVLGLCVTARKVGGRWEYTGYTDGVVHWGPPTLGPTGLDRFGKLDEPYRLILGEGFYGSDLTIADCLFWADRILSGPEVRDAHNGAIDPRALYPADQVIAVDGTGENRGGHPLAARFDTSAGTNLGTGTIEPAGPLAPMPVMSIHGHVMRSGKTLAFRPMDPTGTPGAFAADTPALTVHPSIRVNGGPEITLRNPYYLRTGPFVTYPVTGPRGFRAEPLTASDRVTFTLPTAWLICTGGLTMPCADMPMQNWIGAPGTLAGLPVPPGARTLRGGVNAFFDQPFADYTIVGSPGWQGVDPAEVDAKGDLIRLEESEARLPLTLNLFSGRTNYAWWWPHGPGVPFGLMTVPPGRCAITWTGDFAVVGSENRDAVVDTGIAASGGPRANQQVTWTSITNQRTTFAATAQGRHKLAFDLAYLPGTTGRACATTSAGDDLARPSRSIACNLEWRARKSAGTGPRRDVRFHPPGVDPDDPGHFNPALLQALAEVRPHAIRWIFDLEPSHQTWRDPADLRRTDDSSRRLHTYPEFRQSFPVVSVRDHAEGGFDGAFLPHAHGGGLLVVVCGRPHGFGEFPEAFRVAGSGRSHLTLGDVREPWEGQSFVGRRLSDTELLVPVGISSGYGVRKWLGDALTADLGSVGLPYVPNRLTPDEWIALSNHAGAAPWINVSVATRPSAILELAGRVARGLDPGIGSYWEFGNEIWNTVFATWRACYCAAHSMPGTGARFACNVEDGRITGAFIVERGWDYYFGGAGWYDLEVMGGGGTGAVLRAHFEDGHAFGVEILAAGTGYTSAPTLGLPEANNLTGFGYASPVIPLVCSRTKWLRDLVHAAYEAAGRDPHEAKVVLAGQGEFAGYMRDLVAYSAAADFPIDVLSPATYDQFTGGWNEPGAWSSLGDDDQLFDLLDACVSWAPMVENIAAMRAELDARGYAGATIEAYEGGWESCLPGDPRPDVLALGAVPAALGKAAATSMRLAYLPRMHDIWQARYARYQAAGLDSELQFYWGGDGGGYGGTNPPTSWHAALGPAMLPGRGDGSDGRFDNRTDPLGHDKTVSVIYGAMADWNARPIAPAAPAAELRLAGVMKLAGSASFLTAPPTPILTPPLVLSPRPCPYCGGRSITLVSTFTGRRGYYRCDADGARGPEVRVKVAAELAKAAAEAWDNRVLADAGGPPMKSPELGPCPFCGGTASVQLNVIAGKPIIRVECGRCGATVQDATLDGVIVRWNARVGSGEVPE